METRTQSKFAKERKSGGKNIMKPCEMCKRLIRKHRTDKLGRVVCFNCYQKTIVIMPIVKLNTSENKPKTK